jgi:hypothetical protein
MKPVVIHSLSHGKCPERMMLYNSREMEALLNIKEKAVLEGRGLYPISLVIARGGKG